jgi:hypothetical protein
MTTPSHPSAGASPSDAAAASAEIAEMLVSMALIYTAGSVRAWQRVLDVWVSAMPMIARSLADSAAQGGRRSDAAVAVHDQICAMARELIEAPYQEAHRALAELERMFERFSGRVPQKTAPAATAGDYWRRWEVKP